MHPIRLVTFRHLPLPVQVDSTSEWQQHYAALADRSTSFENHYVQDVSATDPLAVLGERDLKCQLEDVLRGRAVYSAELRLLDDTNSLSPAVGWHFPEAIDGQTFVSDVDVVSEVSRKLHAADFSWLHVDVSHEHLTEELFSAILDAVGCFSETSGRSTIFITSVGGTGDQCPDHFDTLLFEGQIRSPLWLMSPDGESRRVQALTGSYDLGSTLLQAFLPNEETAAHNEDRYSLCDIAQNERQSNERALLIRGEGVSAVRSSKFFYVERSADEHDVDDMPKRALYSKPEDVWNVHDVSGEYPEIAEQQDALLRR